MQATIKITALQISTILGHLVHKTQTLPDLLTYTNITQFQPSLGHLSAADNVTPPILAENPIPPLNTIGAVNSITPPLLAAARLLNYQ